ncbi:hypothetical protein F441_00182 [Phytophthora nicotianae CJ01A1]|uniref:Uncharacterized protein n=1 Tax=Phytophthora nicotianae CJ01A1 TaxID=1317063 RepID=W2XXQ8_PHYNI|nr:hypothetical protein F441_00182 [Phytophthora nicotianae CJ01A1]
MGCQPEISRVKLPCLRYQRICELVGNERVSSCMKALNQVSVIFREKKFEIFEELSSTLPATHPKRDELHEEEVTQCPTESCNTAATIVMTVDPPSAELSVGSVENVEQSVVSGEKSV